MPVQSMTGEFISDYLAKKSKKGIRGLKGGWKESSRNRYKSFISCVMHLAEQKNYINRWPMDDVIHVEEVVEEKEPLTQKQFEMMLSYLPPYVRVIMCFLRYTGMRASELHSLKWRDVKWPDDGSIGYIQLRAANEKGTKLSKRDEGRKIYMTRYISEKLEEMRSGTEWVINNRRVIVWPSDKNLNDLIIPHMSIAKAIDKAVAKLTKATEKFKGEKRWTIEKVTRHLMRHTWATDMAKNNDVKDSVLMRMGGWSSHSMMMRYAKEEDNLQKEAVSKLDGYGDPGDTNLEVIKSA
jgi:integrase